jgi:hypothetical protein
MLGVAGGSFIEAAVSGAFALARAVFLLLCAPGGSRRDIHLLL